MLSMIILSQNTLVFMLFSFSVNLDRISIKELSILDI